MFQHFLITRFNLKPNNKNISAPIASDKWMDERLKLFTHYCFSSVKAQTNQNFIWLVFFDSDTKDKHIQVIKELTKKFSNFKPVYINGAKEFTTQTQALVSSMNTQAHIITSRLDNDDCLHQDYIRTIQDYFDQQNYLAVNFNHGLTLDIGEHARCGYRIHANNPFISLIEKNNGCIDTVIARSHGGWGKIKLVTQIKNKEPMWLSSIHGNNLLNEYFGFGSVKKETLEKFNISQNIMTSLNKRMTKNTLIHSLKYRCKTYFHFYLKNLRHKIRSILKIIPER